VHRAVGAERDGLVQRAHGALRAHRHGDDLLDLDRAALLDLHGGLDGVRVEGVEVLLAAAVQAPRRGSMRFSTAASGTSFTRTQIFKGVPPVGQTAFGILPD
jgi:hypothetical protein